MLHPTPNPVSPALAGSTPADIYRHAARYLTQRGWIQGDYFARDPETDDTAGPFPPACIAGAIGMAICGRVTLDSDRTDTERAQYQHAVDFFNDWLHLTDPEFFDIHRFDPSTGIDLADLHGWNDVPGRTAAEVTKALYAAANEWTFTNDLSYRRHAGHRRTQPDCLWCPPWDDVEDGAQ